MRLLSFLFVLGMLFSACTGESSKSSNENSDGATADSLPAPKDTLRLVLSPNHDCFPIYVAERSGIFRQLGLKVEIRSCASQLECDQTLATGKIDGGWTDEVRLSHTPQIRGYVTALPGKAEWTLFANRTLRVKKTQKLKAKIVVISRLSAEEQWLERALKEGKLTRKDIYTPQINSHALRLSMLNAGQIDAAMLTWPYSVAAEKAGHHKLFQSAPNEKPAGCLLLKESLTKKDSKKKELLLKGIRMANDSVKKKGLKHYNHILEKDYQISLP